MNSREVPQAGPAVAAPAMTAGEMRIVLLDGAWASTLTPTLGDDPHATSVYRRLVMCRRLRSLTSVLNAANTAIEAPGVVFAIADLHGEAHDTFLWVLRQCEIELMLLQRYVLQHQQAVLAATWDSPIEMWASSRAGWRIFQLCTDTLEDKLLPQ